MGMSPDYSGGRGLVMIFGGIGLFILAVLVILIYAVINRIWWLAIADIGVAILIWFAVRWYINFCNAQSTH